MGIPMDLIKCRSTPLTLFDNVIYQSLTMKLGCHGFVQFCGKDCIVVNKSYGVPMHRTRQTLWG
jgi:hypothetical protein